MKVTANTTTVVTTVLTGEVSRGDIESLIRSRVHIPEGATVEIFVTVPGGGDWSSTELMTSLHPVEFRITFEGVPRDKP